MSTLKNEIIKKFTLNLDEIIEDMESYDDKKEGAKLYSDELFDRINAFSKAFLSDVIDRVEQETEKEMKEAYSKGYEDRSNGVGLTEKQGQTTNTHLKQGDTKNISLSTSTEE